VQLVERIERQSNMFARRQLERMYLRLHTGLRRAHLRA
jgi:hypothetical protein